MQNSVRFLVAPVVALLAGLASAQVQIQPLHGTADLLIGDNAGSQILRANDGTGDGDYDDVGELFSYFDPASALDPLTGVPYGAAKLGTPTGMAISLTGHVYVADGGTTRTMFRLRDENSDGDANDPGESNIFFDPSNAAGLTSFAIQGLAIDLGGTVYVTASGQGTGFTAIDRLFRLADGNGDGDANDPGEQAVVYDRATSVANGNPSLDVPSWMALLPDGSLVATNAFSSNQGAFRLADTSPVDGDFNGTGEVAAIYSGANGNPLPKFSFCGRFGLDGRLFLYNISDKRLIAATDGNGNGVYDDAGEGVAFAATGDGGITIGAGFSFDVRDDGAVIFGDTGASPNNRLLMYADGNGNGVASDAGEASVVLSFSTSPFPGARPRHVLFLPRLEIVFAPGCPATNGIIPVLGIDLAGGGIPKAGNATFGFRITSAPPGVGVAVVAALAVAPLDLNSLLPGISPPGCTLFPDLLAPTTLVFAPPTVTDPSGTLVVPVPLPPLPGIQGATIFAQALTIDPLSTTPLITSTGIEIRIL